MDWLDLLAVQGTLKNLLHHHTSWQIDGETVKDFIFLGSKITADDMKLKDTSFLEEKL